MDLRKSLQLAFFFTLSGCLLLVLLALTGIFGQMYIVDAGDRGIRYTFGLGHPNAFFCMFWVLVTLGIYLYWRKMKLWMYGLLLAAGLVLGAAAGSQAADIKAKGNWTFTWQLGDQTFAKHSGKDNFTAKQRLRTRSTSSLPNP